MEHMKYLMAAFHKHILPSWRGSAVLYYDIISIQLNAEIWILACTDISIDTSTGNFKHYNMFVYECWRHCYWSANSRYFVLKNVGSSFLWWYTSVITWFQGPVIHWILRAHHHWLQLSMHIEQYGVGCVTPPL